MIRNYVIIFILFVFTLRRSIASTCPLPETNVNSKVETSALETGSVASYSCDIDYELFGDAKRTCGADGKWSGEAPICATNVGWRKPANQSSTVTGGAAENANDGDTTTVHDGSKCTETLVEDSPWWSVDLLQVYEVSHIRVTTRGCCGSGEVQDLEVRVGISPDSHQRNRLCTWHPGKIENGATKTLKCARPIEGRYVSLQMVGVVGSLSLCEVQVFSKQELSKDRCHGNVDVQKLGLFNKTCYEFQITSGGSFDIARQYCRKHKGGDLVYGIDAMTQKFLVSELKRLEPEMQTKMLWIGAQKEPQFISRTWRWVDGTKVDSPAWGRDQPNNYNGEQNCVVIDASREWRWNDVGCNLNYLVWMCQFEPSCGTPNRNLNTTVAIKSTKNGTVALYSCPEGNKLEGDEERNCSSVGDWTGRPPLCKYVECGSPPSIENGVVSLVDKRSNFGGKALYVCAENYTIDGNDTVTCGDGGQWLPSIPKCLYSWCSDLEAPTKGRIEMSGKRSGDSATFICDSGYFLIGQKTLSCTLGGEWSGEVPQCRYIDCGVPESVEKGKMILMNSTTFVGSKAKYECDENHWLRGLSVRTCESTGFWTGENPVCELIDCGEPGIPVGGYITGYSFKVDSEVEYHCEKGHYLTGDARTVCNKQGKWTGMTPNCTFVDCGRVPPLEKGEVVFEDEDLSTYLDSKLLYKCNTNYRLIGSSSRVCQNNRQWSGDTPKCEEIRCPEPKHPMKSRFLISGNDRRVSLALTRTRLSLGDSNASYRVGTQITYRCERGYVVEGTNARTCLINGTWSDESPNCKFVDCGKPPNVENGVFRLLSNETNFGSVAAYECDPNWKINGKVRRFCQENGTWSGPYPECQEILCPSLSKSLEKLYKAEDERQIEPWNDELLAKREHERQLRLKVDDGPRKVGTEAYYKCRNGQKIIGEQTRLCAQHGLWDGKEPKCEWIFCSKPKEIQNGRVHIVNDDFKFGSIAEYFCLPKYYLHGPFNRTCTGEGTWSGPDPNCTLDDRPYVPLENNNIEKALSNPKGQTGDEETEEPSYTGIYVGIGVSFVLVAGVVCTLLFFRHREQSIGKVGSSNSSNSSSRPVENSFPPQVSYGNLNDPTTGNNIYEQIPDDVDPSYTNMSPIYNTFTSRPPSDYSNYPQHTYSNSGSELQYSNSSAASVGRKVPSNISKRPRMPPPQPPTIPRSPSSAGVTINGVSLNSS